MILNVFGELFKFAWTITKISNYDFRKYFDAGEKNGVGVDN